MKLDIPPSDTFRPDPPVSGMNAPPMGLMKLLEAGFVFRRQNALFFRRGQPHEAVDGVRCAVFHAVIVTHLQLAQQADGEQLNASQDQHSRDHKQRPMQAHCVLLRADNFHRKQDYREETACDHAQRAKNAKKVKRATHIAEQEADG